MFKKSKLFFLRTFYPITLFKSLTLVCREKESYDKNSFSIWWEKSIGTGVMGKPNHEFKFFMLGLSIVHIRMWIHVCWIGKSKNPQPLQMRDPYLKIQNWPQ